MAAIARAGRLVAVALIAAAASACTSMQSFGPTELKADPSLLEPGEQITLRTNDGGRDKTRFVGVSDTALRIRGQDVAWERVDRVQARRFSSAKTFGLIGGLALIYFGIREGLESVGEGLAECFGQPPGDRPEGCPDE